MKFDPLTALMRFLNGRPEREAELMAASNRNLGIAREANARAVAAFAALEKVIDLVHDDLPEEERRQAIIETAQDALADLTSDARAIDLAAKILVALSHGASVGAGWWLDPETGESLAGNPYVIGTKLMLIVSEISEAMEGHRKGLMDDKLPHRLMIEVELADAVIRIGDLAGVLGLDLGGAIAEKMRFNAQRPDHKLENRVSAGGKAY